MCINQMLYWALNNKNANIIYVSPTYMLAREVFSKLLTSLDGSKEEDVENNASHLIQIRNKTNLSITFVNGSKITCFSGERYENLRGLTVTHAVLDEFAYVKSELWDKVLKASTMVHGKKVVFISTPAGKNHFYKMFLIGKSGRKGYQSFTSPSTENPFMNPDEITEMSTTDLIYQQEYLAKFVDTSLTIFKNLKEVTYPEIMQANYKIPGMKYAIGIDLGRAHDYTCAVCLDSNRRVVDILRTRYKDWKDIISEVELFYKKWMPEIAYLEINQGDNILEILHDRDCRKIRPFFTSQTTKPMIVQDLALAFEEKKISIPNIDYVHDELDSFTFRFNANTRKITYSAPNGLHDDFVIGLCLANHAWKNIFPTRKKLNYSII